MPKRTDIKRVLIVGSGPIVTLELSSLASLGMTSSLRWEDM